MDMNNKNEKCVWLSALTLGGIGFFLRYFLYQVGYDRKGLLVRWHPLTTTLVACGAVMLIIAAVMALTREKGLSAGPVGTAPAIGSLCLILGLSVTLIRGRQNGLPVYLQVLGFVAAAALAVAAVFQLMNKQPHFLTHGILCLFLGFYLVNRYQMWRHVPQLTEYLPGLLAGVSMLLYSYHLSAGSLGQLSRRAWLAVSGMGIFLCLTAGSGGEAANLCLGAGLWMLTGLWTGTGEGEQAL